jgi:hypothetical protein
MSKDNERLRSPYSAQHRVRGPHEDGARASLGKRLAATLNARAHESGRSSLFLAVDELHRVLAEPGAQVVEVDRLAGNVLGTVDLDTMQEQLARMTRGGSER